MSGLGAAWEAVPVTKKISEQHRRSLSKIVNFYSLSMSSGFGPQRGKRPLSSTWQIHHVIDFMVTPLVGDGGHLLLPRIGGRGPNLQLHRLQFRIDRVHHQQRPDGPPTAPDGGAAVGGSAPRAGSVQLDGHHCSSRRRKQPQFLFCKRYCHKMDRIAILFFETHIRGGIDHRGKEAGGCIV